MSSSAERPLRSKLSRLSNLSFPEAVSEFLMAEKSAHFQGRLLCPLRDIVDEQVERDIQSRAREALRPNAIVTANFALREKHLEGEFIS